MKKLLLTFLLVAPASLFAQGTFLFANFVNGSVDAPIFAEHWFDGSPVTVIGPQFKADVIVNGFTLATQDFFGSEAGAGYFVGPVIEVPGTNPGDTVSVTLAAYNSASSLLVGFSDPFDVELGGDSLPPGLFVNLQSFTFGTIPEPSTIALIAIGTGVLFYRFKKTSF